MNPKILPLLATIILLLSTGCSQAVLTPVESPIPAATITLDPTMPEPQTTQPDISPIVPSTHTLDKFLHIIDAMAASNDIAAKDITLISYEAVDWSDSCLGVYRPGIACLEVITPGYKIILGTPNGQIEVHTNIDATTYQVVATDSGIKGLALIGPACPGPVRPGQECPDQPYQGIIQILDNNENAVVEVTTAEDGSFQVELPPGNYILSLPSGNKFPIAAPQTVSVLAGKYSEVQFLLDSGIR